MFVLLLLLFLLFIPWTCKPFRKYSLKIMPTFDLNKASLGPYYATCPSVSKMVNISLLFLIYWLITLVFILWETIIIWCLASTQLWNSWSITQNVADCHIYFRHSVSQLRYTTFQLSLFHNSWFLDYNVLCAFHLK